MIYASAKDQDGFTIRGALYDFLTGIGNKQLVAIQLLNLGRDILYGPNLFVINGSLSRLFNITERFKLTFRGEAFNVTNTPQFDQPDTTFGDTQFGQITTANNNAQSVKSNPNRLLQVSLRLTF